MPKLPEPQIVALQQAVAAAQAKLDAVRSAADQDIRDIYTGRDATSGVGSYLAGEGGIPWIINTTKIATPWSLPDIGANLFQSRLLQQVTELVPALPAFQVEPLVGEAARRAEDQNILSQWSARHGNLKNAVRDLALYGSMSSHIGLKVVWDKSKPLHERIRYIPLTGAECGFEPGGRRFVWHVFERQWGDLPKSHRFPIKAGTEAPPKPWEVVRVTEVYHPGWNFVEGQQNKCPVSIFTQRRATGSEPTWVNESAFTVTIGNDAGPPKSPLGTYVGTEYLDHDCPILISQFLPPAPGEDISPPEVLSWLPLMRAIYKDLRQIEEEVGSINNVVLVDSAAISEDQIAAMSDNPSGRTLYIRVDTTQAAGFERDNGVSHKARPIERNTALGEIISALQTHLSLLDQVIGASPTDQGIAQQPRKSAAEASILAQASSRRTRYRLGILADLMANAAQVAFSLQRKAYGPKVSIPVGGGISKVIEVPDPKVAKMAFRVDAVELGNLSKQGQIETHAASLSLMTNLFAQFQGAIPAPLKLELKKYLEALGNPEAALRVQAPTMEGGPQDRYVDFLTGRSSKIPVDPQDEHQLFIAFYSGVLEQAAAEGISGVPVVELQRVLAEHTQAAQRAQAAQAPANLAPVPGANQRGQFDNQALGALASGQIPLDQISLV